MLCCDAVTPPDLITPGPFTTHKMSRLIQEHFRDLAEPSHCDWDGDAAATAGPAPLLARVSPHFLTVDSVSCSPDLEIADAAMKCEVLRMKKEMSSMSQKMNEQQVAFASLEEKHKHELECCRVNEEKDRTLLAQQLESLTKCQQELQESREQNEKICLKEKATQALCDELLKKEKLSAEDFHNKCNKYDLSIREKQAEIDAVEKKLSDAMSEKNMVDESFRLFKNSIMTDVAHDGEEGSDKNLMIKIRLLQETNAQLSAEIKSVTRKCADAEVDVSAVKEELSLSERMKNRLSSSVDNQAKEIEVLEKKLLLAHNTLLQEQSATESITESRKAAELQNIQLKFEKQRLERTITDLEDANRNLEKSLEDQIIENKRWVDRLKDAENTFSAAHEKSKHEIFGKLEQALSAEKDKVKAIETECAALREANKLVANSFHESGREIVMLKSKVSALETQLDTMSEMEECLSSIQNELESKEDEIATLCQAFEKRGDAMKELEKRISLQASEISFLRPERDSKAKIAKTFEGQLQALEVEKSELLRVSTQNDSRGVLIDQLKVTVMQYEQKLKNIEDDKEALKAANAALDALKTEYRVLKDDYDDVEATIEQLSSDAADEIQHREKKIRTLSMLVDEKEADCIRMQAEIYDLKKETAKLQKQIKDAEDAATANAWFSK